MLMASCFFKTFLWKREGKNQTKVACLGLQNLSAGLMADQLIGKREKKKEKNQFNSIPFNQGFRLSCNVQAHNEMFILSTLLEEPLPQSLLSFTTSIFSADFVHCFQLF